MRLVPRIDDRPPLHGVHALQFAEKITALRDLESMQNKTIFVLDCKLSRARKNLPRHQKGLDVLRQRVPWERAGQQIILMAPVAVAHEVGVVLVKSNGRTKLLR